MHLVHFDLSALLSVAIHPIQFILPLQPPFVSGSDDLCEKTICAGIQGRTSGVNLNVALTITARWLVCANVWTN